ncbi:hypothetical protein P7H70_09920 [Vagococcus carniphilus]|uniref:MapZ extracellular domain-containing protein n=1 Tax=Vagococcus carniphilus TaxID=218144 RepID=A0AAW8UAT1_9ENTE|nr:hypothetical protein [Vagococcus carniphilus]MDT2834377.1 hypothetical protein [Vagococcus carniphilus]
MNKGNKLIWLFLSIAFAVGAIVVGSMYDNKKKEDLVKEVGVEEGSKEMTLSSLYFDKSKVFLAKGTTEQKINIMEKSAKNDEDKKMVKDLKQRIEVQTRFNDLFEEPVLVGNKFKEKVSMKNDNKKEDIDNLVSDASSLNKKEDPFYEGVLTYLATAGGSDGKETTHTEKSGNAQKAQEIINMIIVDGAVQSDFTLEQYYAAKQEVDGLPEGAEKTELMQQITQIQTALTNMGITY